MKRATADGELVPPHGPVQALYCWNCGTPILIYYRPDEEPRGLRHYRGICGGCGMEHTAVG